MCEVLNFLAEKTLYELNDIRYPNGNEILTNQWLTFSKNHKEVLLAM